LAAIRWSMHATGLRLFTACTAQSTAPSAVHEGRKKRVWSDAAAKGASTRASTWLVGWLVGWVLEEKKEEK